VDDVLEAMRPRERERLGSRRPVLEGAEIERASTEERECG
jgi:hypothetical protein